jgi:hypothetical protein
VTVVAKRFAWTGPRHRDATGSLFATAGAFMYGSGLVIVPLVCQELVHDDDWLSHPRFA